MNNHETGVITEVVTTDIKLLDPILPLEPIALSNTERAIKTESEPLVNPGLELYTLYNLTFNGKRYVSSLPPDNLPPKNYSLIIIQYNIERIINIKGIYITPSEKVIEVEFKDLDIKSILTINNTTNDTDDNYLDIVKEYYNNLELEEGLNILLSVDLLDQDNSNNSNNSNNDKVTKIFIVGLSSVLVYYSFIQLDKSNSNNLEKPFYPFSIDIPVDGIGLEVVDNKLFQYINYIAKIFISIPSKKIGKYWIEQCIKFHNAFGPLLPNKYTISEASINKAIYLAITGYSQWLAEEGSIISQHINTLNEMIEEGCNDIEYNISQGLLRVEERLSSNNNNNNSNLEIERYKRYCKKCLKRCKEIEHKYYKLEKRLQSLEKDKSNNSKSSNDVNKYSQDVDSYEY